MYETTKGEKVDPKPESCPKRAEGSSAKAGTVNHCGQKAARPKQERSTSAQKAARPKPKSCPKRSEGSSPKAGTVDHCGQKAARPKPESCPKRAECNSPNAGTLTRARKRQLVQSQKVAPSGQRQLLQIKTGTSFSLQVRNQANILHSRSRSSHQNRI
jgi:hypothetical protein